MKTAKTMSSMLSRGAKMFSSEPKEGKPKEKDFRVWQDKDNERPKLIKRIEEQRKRIPEYTLEEKIKYTEERLKCYMDLRKSSDSSWTIDKLLKVLRSEARLLLKLASHQTTMREKHAALEELGLTDVLFAPDEGFEKLTPLFLKAFDQALNHTALHILRKYILASKTPAPVPGQAEQAPAALLPHEYFNLKPSLNVYVERALDTIGSRSIAELTPSSINSIQTLIPLLIEGLTPECIKDYCAIVGVHEPHEFDESDIPGAKLFFRQSPEKIQDIKSTKLYYQLAKYSESQSLPSTSSLSDSAKDMSPEKLLEYKKSIQAFSSSITNRAIKAMQEKPFVYESINPLALINVLATAISLGFFEDMRGVTLVPVTQVVFGYDSYLIYKRLSEVIPALKVTPFEIAERMVGTVGNGHMFGYLDLFSLKMLRSIFNTPDDDFIADIKAKAPADIEYAHVIGRPRQEIIEGGIITHAPKEKARLEKMLEAANSDHDLAIALKIAEILENVRIYASIIDYAELKELLDNTPTHDGGSSKDYLAAVKTLAAEALAMVEANTDPEAIAVRYAAAKAAVAEEEKKAAAEVVASAPYEPPSATVVAEIVGVDEQEEAPPLLAEAVDESEEIARLRAEVARLRGGKTSPLSSSAAFFPASPYDSDEGLEEKQPTPDKASKPPSSP